MMTLFWNIYVSFDLFMLGLYNQIQATGLYGASQKLFNAVIAPAIILPNIYIPIFTKAFKEKKSIKKTLVSLTITSLGCAIALAIAGIFFPKFIMQLIYGQEYISASFSLTILCITAALYYINNIFFSLAFALYQDKKILFTNIFMATLNIVLNIFVIPVYSFNGAAVTTLISTIFLLIGNAYICYIAFKNKNNLLYSNQEKENE
ncbi:MAG: polysaccharide biosynthesis C-terminal domain-containing protein [Candidatus Pacebacteria bacterium]|nr:polysaccharide biosynthesis C-terminal domain-containing protein [Candidatus Paceibacterota bacterium]